MTQEISSLMDGELTPEEAERAIRAACADREALEAWKAYHVIGEALRGAQPHATDCADRVMAALAAEPAIIARPKPATDHWGIKVALAAAASVATLGIVGWIGQQGGQAPSAVPTVAKGNPAVQPVSNTSSAPAPVDTRLYEGIHRQVPTPDIYIVNNNSAGAKRP